MMPLVIRRVSPWPFSQSPKYGLASSSSAVAAILAVGKTAIVGKSNSARKNYGFATGTSIELESYKIILQVAQGLHQMSKVLNGLMIHRLQNLPAGVAIPFREAVWEKRTGYDHQPLAGKGGLVADSRD